MILIGLKSGFFYDGKVGNNNCLLYYAMNKGLI